MEITKTEKWYVYVTGGPQNPRGVLYERGPLSHSRPSCVISSDFTPKILHKIIPEAVLTVCVPWFHGLNESVYLAKFYPQQALDYHLSSTKGFL